MGFAAIATFLGVLLPAAAGAAAPQSQPAGLDLEKAARLLWAADADTRQRAAKALAGLDDRKAVEPLIVALTARYAAGGRVRIVPAASGRSVGQAVAFPRRFQYHADRLGGDAFLQSVLAHPRAAEWSWVRRRRPSGPPTALLGRLRGSLRSRTSGGVDFEVILVGADRATLSPMLSMLLSMYAKESRTRSGQRDLRVKLEADLPAAVATMLADRKELAAFNAAGDLDRAKAALDAQQKKAEPLEDDLATATDTLADAVKIRNRRKDERDEAREAEDDLEQDIKRTRRRLADAVARRDPNNPDPILERQIANLDARLRGLRDDEDDAERKVDDAERDLRRAERDMTDAREKVRTLRRRIDRLLRGATELLAKVQRTFDQLAARALGSEARVAVVRNQLTVLPSTDQLAGDDAYLNPVRTPVAVAALKRPLAERKLLIESLGKLRDHRAVAALIDLLKSPDTPLHAPAAAALKAITGQDLGTDPAKWKAWRAAQPN